MRDHLITFLEFLAAAFIAAIVMMCAERHIRPHAGPEAGTAQIDSVKTQVDTSTAVSPDPSETRPLDTVYIKVYLPAPSVPAPADSVPEVADSVPAPADSVPEVADSVPAPADSVLYLPVVIEQKVYEDPDSTYRAVVSGPALSEEYGPRLDSIQVFSRSTIQYQTKTVYAEPSRWSIGIQAGYGASKEGLTPYLGIGVQYQLWSPKTKRRSPP